MRFFVKQSKQKYDYPQGVSYSKQKNKLRVKIAVDGKEKHINFFDLTKVEEAENAYLEEKIKAVSRQKELLTEEDKHLAIGFDRCVAYFKQKITNNLETIKRRV